MAKLQELLRQLTPSDLSGMSARLAAQGPGGVKLTFIGGDALVMRWVDGQIWPMSRDTAQKLSDFTPNLRLNVSLNCIFWKILPFLRWNPEIMS